MKDLDPRLRASFDADFDDSDLETLERSSAPDDHPGSPPRERALEDVPLEMRTDFSFVPPAFPLPELPRPKFPGVDFSRPDFSLPRSDRENGFMLYYGTRRLGETPLLVDLPIGEKRFVPISLLCLGDGEERFRASLDAGGTRSQIFVERAHLVDRATADANAQSGRRDPPQERKVIWDRFSEQRDGEQWSERRRDLAPAPTELRPYTRELLRHRLRFWIEVSSEGLAGNGQHRLELELELRPAANTGPGLPRRPAVRRRIPIRLQVWPVRLDSEHAAFHLRTYNGGVMHWNATDGEGAYQVTPQSLDQRFRPVLEALREVGGDVIDWTVHWPSAFPQLRLAGRAYEEVAPELDLGPADGFDPENPHDLAQRLARMPRIDFSHYEPLLQLWIEHGIRRVDTQGGYLRNADPDEPSPFLRGLLHHGLGPNRIDPESNEARFFYVWFFSELRRFVGDRFEEGFAKIGDEIRIEHMDPYIEAAKLLKLAGWRPFTTITGQLASSSEHLGRLLPHCEQLQVNRHHLRTVRSFFEQPFALRSETFPVPGPWAAYGNGSAQRTWSKACFGPGSVTEIDGHEIDDFELTQDGEPLPILTGSPWGNHAPDGPGSSDVVFTAGAVARSLYVSPSTGTPDDHEYELTITRRVPDPDGEPLLSLPDGHELWFYTGRTRPSLVSYETAYQWPILAMHENLDGFGWWAFYYWYEESRILERDEDGDGMLVSPAWAGLRDGFRDALLLARVRQQNPSRYRRLLGERPQSILRLVLEEALGRDIAVIGNRRDYRAHGRARRSALFTLA